MSGRAQDKGRGLTGADLAEYVRGGGLPDGDEVRPPFEVLETGELRMNCIRPSDYAAIAPAARGVIVDTRVSGAFAKWRRLAASPDGERATSRDQTRVVRATPIPFSDGDRRRMGGMSLFGTRGAK